ncbi:MAG TPA: prepilin-type N-terminal cleavage/methylation domain-containing protein [Paenalcaligenes sp.]|nr:prepilin-type N-terminal cleavage/methylation domain-containing protein [Paenalcaligenes sp.]
MSGFDQAITVPALSSGRKVSTVRDQQVLPQAVSAQSGFSLIEVSLVTAIVLLLAVIAVPAITNYVIENRVPKVAEELARFMLNNEIAAPTSTSSPYQQVDVTTLSYYVTESGVLDVRGQGASTRVLHGLGNDGQISLQPVDQGERYRLSLDKVHHAACPGIASVLQRVSHHIEISAGTGAATVVKGDGVTYNALLAKSACGRGAVNTFSFIAG